MFSVSCAQKAAKMKASTRRELETWEKRRREQAVEEARRRVELKGKGTPGKKRFPVGYGPDGRVPGYVEAYLSALQASPLGKPVFSPGRRRVRPDHMRLPSPSPERRQFVQGAAPAKVVREQAKRNAGTLGSRSLRARPVSSSGRCSTTTKPQKKTWAERSPMIAPTRSSTDTRGASSNTSDSHVRPATAPNARPLTAHCAQVKTRRTFPGGGQRRSLSASSCKGEEQLLKRIARLSGVRQGSEHPTVATLKHAVAIRAIQAQLRECRGGDRATGGGSPQQAVSGVASSSPERQVGSNTGIETWCSTKRRGRRRGFEPWDNRAPFIPEDKSQADRGASPIAPSPLKILTCDDPVFGISEECPRRSTSASRSTYDLGEPNTPIVEERRQEDATVRGVKKASGTVSSAEVIATKTTAATAAAARELEACFRRLTISALVELNHLQHPPKPVRVVLSGLACLLGWQRKRSQRIAPPRSLFSNAYVLRNIMASVRPERITSRRLSAVAKRLDVQDAAPAKVKGANAAASMLLDWLRAVVACARAHEA